MFIAKLKMRTLLLITAGFLGLGTTWLADRVLADRPEIVLVQDKDNPIPKDAPRKDAPKDGDKDRRGKNEPAREKDREPGTIRGILKELDLGKGTITIRFLADGNQGTETYNLFGKDVKVSTTTDTELKLADLRLGAIVNLKLKDNTDVVAVRVEQPVVSVFLSNIDAGKNTVSFRSEGGVITVPVHADARIIIKGEAAKLAAVPVGLKVQLTLSVDRATVVGIVSATERRPDAGGKVREGDLPREGGKGRDGDAARGAAQGVVIDLDQAKSTLTLLVNQENPSMEVFDVAKDAKVRILFEKTQLEEITFAKLAKTVNVSVFLSPDRKTVTAIDARAPVLRAIVKNVDAANRKLTLGGGDQPEKTIDIAAAVQFNPGRDLKLADLRAGTPVLLGLSLDRTQVLAIQFVPTRRDGER